MLLVIQYAGPESDLHIFRLQCPPILSIDRHRLDGLFAQSIHEHDALACRVRHVLFAPLRHRDKNGVQLQTPFGEAVFGMPRAVGFLENAFFNQGFQPEGEDVARNAQFLLELVETGEPEERIAHDEKRPMLADNGQRLGEGTVELVEGFEFHGLPGDSI